MTGADDKPGDDEPEERFTLPEGPVQEEIYPTDFITLLFELMDYIADMDAHVDAAFLCLQEARVYERTNGTGGPGDVPDLERERAYWLLSSIRGSGRIAAERVRETLPEVSAYCKRQRIELPEKAEEKD